LPTLPNSRGIDLSEFVSTEQRSCLEEWGGLALFSVFARRTVCASVKVTFGKTAKDERIGPRRGLLKGDTDGNPIAKGKGEGYSKNGNYGKESRPRLFRKTDGGPEPATRV
jgi:hypothetical protein